MRHLVTISFMCVVAAAAVAADLDEPQPPAPATATATTPPDPAPPDAAVAEEKAVVPAETAAETERPAETSVPEAAPGPLDVETVRATVSSYIEHDMKLKGGFFLVYDVKYKRVWKLDDPKIGGQVRVLDDSTGVACVIATSGRSATSRALDVDVFVSRPTAGAPVVSEIRVHRSDNRERYWYDKENKIQTGPRK